MTDPARAFLKDLRREIETHPAVNHLFLNRIATSPFSRQDYAVLAANHFPLVCVFTSYLETLLVRAPNSESKLWLAKVLVDEYGEGSEGKDHSTLYARFLEAAGGDRSAALADALPTPAHEFISEHRRIVSKRPFLEGLGAVGPGHEWAIPKMFDAIIPGLRRAGFSEEDIGYFTLHVLQDDDHGAWLEESLVRYASDAKGREQIRRGALASLEARGRFWDGVQRAVMRYRQPRAARPDGKTQRSLPHEVLLTAWDGVETLRRSEAWVRALGERIRPTLEQAIASTRNL